MSTPTPIIQEKKEAQADARSVGTASSLDDDKKLLEIGYVPSFKREFSNVATVRACHLQDELGSSQSPRSASRSASWVSARVSRRLSTLP